MIDSTNYLSKGFLTFALNTPGSKIDYVKIAYLQALSIKHTQKHNQFAIAVEDSKEIPDKYKEVFDYVIDVPWGIDSVHEVWKLSDEWKSIYITPFDMTFKLDSDMLFFDDLSDWWYNASHQDLCPTINVRDYRLKKSSDLSYRPEVKLKNLPLFYSALFYFRKSTVAFQLFEVVEEIYKNWEEYNKIFFEGCRFTQATTDVVFALASDILDISYANTTPTFVHMKKNIQNLQQFKIEEDWTKSLKYYFDSNMNLFVENYKQTIPFHYNIKSFATDQLIAKYEKVLGI